MINIWLCKKVCNWGDEYMKIIGLIAGTSGDALTDELHKRGYSVAIVCGKANEPGYNKADFLLSTDLKDCEEIYHFFMNNNVRKVIVGTGHELAFDVAEYLTRRGISTNINIRNSKLAKDKYLFKNAITKIGIDTPESLLIDSFDQFMIIRKNIVTPCVVKSTIDTIQPCKVNNVKELEESVKLVLSTDSKVLVEEYIDGNDCTVVVMSDGSIIKNLGVTYYSKAKEYDLKGFENSRSVEMSKGVEKAICHIAEKIVKDLEFTGLMRVDFIVSERIYVLELNSVIVTGYNGSLSKFFKKQVNNINLASIFIDTVFPLMGL